MEKEDRVISEFLQSIGPWKNHIVIGGGYALIIYKLYLANQRNAKPPVGTRDIDSLIPHKVPITFAKNLSNYLKDSGFKVIFKNYQNPATEAYVKEIEGLDVEIEFLTDITRDEDKINNIVIAGVSAQPLSYLQLSLQKTIAFNTFSSEIGRVVSPGAWMFHKGLTFPKRSNRSKIYKDLYGIWYVSTQLGEFSDEASNELKSLMQQYAKWSMTFKGNLHRWMDDVTPNDWIRLEAQDPFGRLKKTAFERLIKTLAY